MEKFQNRSGLLVEIQWIIVCSLWRPVLQDTVPRVHTSLPAITQTRAKPPVLQENEEMPLYCTLPKKLGRYLHSTDSIERVEMGAPRALQQTCMYVPTYLTRARPNIDSRPSQVGIPSAGAGPKTHLNTFVFGPPLLCTWVFSLTGYYTSSDGGRGVTRVRQDISIRYLR